MKLGKTLGVLVVLLLFLSAFNFDVDDVINISFKKYFSKHHGILLQRITELSEEIKKKKFSVDSAKSLLEHARMEYKSIEPFVIYYLPGDAQKINRPVINEIEEDDEVSAYIIPHGFQYIEKLLYGDSALMQRKIIVGEVDYLYILVSKLNESIQYMDLRERDIFEAMQMHDIRQFMLGLANFETSESKNGISESIATLKFYKELISQLYNEKDLTGSYFTTVDNAVSFLEKTSHGFDPDYFEFYSHYYIPFSEELESLRHSVVKDNFYNTSAINYQVRSVFDSGAFNSFFFLPAKPVSSPDSVALLGRTLFFDPALSANNLRACASCHQPGKAFTDGRALSQSFEPGKDLSRNAPTVINSVLQRKLFHDGRAFTFEDQAGQVMSNPLEMHNDFSQVAFKLKQSQEYKKWFREAFRNSSDTVITSKSILTAISEYERSITGLNSRFDRSVSGRGSVMNDEEKKGFNIYMGKGNCASCHFIPLFNGVMPPEYTETEWEILGVPSARIVGKRELDNDIGRAGIVNLDIFRHAFKIPTLRNIELTGPYMHNGVFKTLEEVIEFYNIGGGTGLGYDVPYQTLSSEPLHLTENEKSQLISFLKTLTDTANLTSVPHMLPAFPEELHLNDRKIGGDY
jgi:cytochrome c peroxidase